MTPVERVARALRGYMGDGATGERGAEWAAIDAIAALAEPSEKMLAAGFNALPFDEMQLRYVANAYRAMIAAALAEDEADG